VLIFPGDEKFSTKHKELPKMHQLCNWIRACKLGVVCSSILMNDSASVLFKKNYQKNHIER
jgi:hypothetical protein